jgi:hypothetical protein
MKSLISMFSSVECVARAGLLQETEKKVPDWLLDFGIADL